MQYTLDSVRILFFQINGVAQVVRSSRSTFQINPHHLGRVAVERFCAELQQTLVPASKGAAPYSEFSTHTVCIEELAVPNVKATVTYNRMRPTLSLAPLRDLE